MSAAKPISRTDFRAGGFAFFNIQHHQSLFTCDTLFCGSYPITPATGILEELAIHKSLGCKTLQVEDEIAGICTAMGAAFAGRP